ncbi:hypothetical protein QCA50_005131 [Cerrena zonata]|uniref:DM2 domain-containing protein n=1 Tax=Cerrena zonata TaxID=2478898 RepID=A0AAW0GED7_9APHY
MSFDLQSLAPHIRSILTAPGVDLETISAKRVRKRLIEEIPSLTSDIVRDRKDEIDPIISSVFHEVFGPQGQDGDEEEEEHSTKRKHEDDDGDAPRPKNSKRSKKEAPTTDEEIARKLDQELNSRQRSSRSGAKPKKTTTKRGKKVKSAETVDSDGEQDKPKKRGGGLNKEYALSEPLAILLGIEKLSRPQVVKQIWVYIKANDLQNPEDKREIMCDEKLKDLFHADKINMFKMNQLLGQHLLEPHETS